MRTLLATTILASFVAGPVFAQTATAPAFVESAGVNDMRASTLIGERVYTAEADVDPAVTLTDVDAGWNDIGEVNDVLLSADGSVQAILVDIGGFLGIGEKTVAVPLSSLKRVADGDSEGDYFLVFTANKAALETAPAYEMSMAEPMAEPVTTTDTTAAAPAATDTAVTDTAVTDTAVADTPAADAAMMEEGYSEVAVSEMTTEQLTGAPVYDASNEKIGDVSHLIVSSDGTISDAVVDVGGFLGIGEKPLAVPMAEITITRKADADDLRLHVSATKEALEAMPAYEG